jgi:hypothetical protein
MTARCIRRTCPEQPALTIVNNVISLDGITTYMRVLSTLTATLAFNAARTVIQMAYAPVSAEWLWVYQDGMLLTPSVHYSLSGSTLTFTPAIQAESSITVRMLSQNPGAVTSAVEVGSIIGWHTGITIPDGYLECNGQAINRTTYAALFSKIGTLYGVGDGSSTFNLPDRENAYYNNPNIIGDIGIIKV